MAVDRSAVDFGRTLREARERRGVSVRQIANATKISASALEALERNDISRLPGGIFSRAFVRSYAVEVGLDPEATIQAFIERFQDESVTAGHSTLLTPDDNEAIESSRRMATTFVRIAAISVPLVIAVVYFGTTSGRRASRTEPAAVVASEPARAPEPAPLATAMAPAAADGDAPVAAAPDVLTVVLSATRDSWVSATVDGDKPVEHMLHAGDEQSLTVHREVVLKAGDAGAVLVSVNGAEAKPLGQNGQVVTTRLTPSAPAPGLAPQ